MLTVCKTDVSWPCNRQPGSPVGDNAVLDGVLEGEDTTLGLSLIAHIGILLAHANHDTCGVTELSMQQSCRSLAKYSLWKNVHTGLSSSPEADLGKLRFAVQGAGTFSDCSNAQETSRQHMHVHARGLP